MGMLTPNSDLVPKYLFYLMTSGAYEDFIAALADGMNINNLKFDDLRQFSVPCPPLPEQERIVAQLDRFTKEVQRLESIYRRRQVALTELRRSVLHRAFTGQP